MDKKQQQTMSPMAFRLCMLALAAFIAVMYVYIKGNPITKFKIDKHAETYLAENYPEIARQVQTSQGAYYTDFGHTIVSTDGVEHNPDKGWGIYFYNPDNYLMNFAMRYDKKGNLLFDGCKEYYMKGGSILNALSGEYREFIVGAKNDEYYNGMGAVGISPAGLIREIGAEAWFDGREDPNGVLTKMEYTGPVLDINKEYTMEELANQYGVINFTFREDDDGDIDSLYNRCIEVRNFTEKYNLPFATVNVGTRLFDGTSGLTKEELYSDNLKEIIEDKYSTIWK